MYIQYVCSCDYTLKYINSLDQLRIHHPGQKSVCLHHTVLCWRLLIIYYTFSPLIWQVREKKPDSWCTGWSIINSPGFWLSLKLGSRIRNSQRECNSRFFIQFLQAETGPRWRRSWWRSLRCQPSTWLTSLSWRSMGVDRWQVRQIILCADDRSG